MAKEPVIFFFFFASLGFTIFPKYSIVLKRKNSHRCFLKANGRTEIYRQKLRANFTQSGSKQSCQSLPCYMIYEIYKLVEETAKTPPPHLIYLYFHKRTWFSNWLSEISDILLQPTMKANTTCQDYLLTTNPGQLSERPWAEEQVF